MEPRECVFCGSEGEQSYRLPTQLGWTCERCALRLADLVQHEPALSRVWPALAETEDDDEPEPVVRLADGSKVELRSRTEALKKELSVAQRAELVTSYVELELFKEAVLEAAHVLKTGGPSEREKVLAQLFTLPLAAPEAPERLRPFLVRTLS